MVAQPLRPARCSSKQCSAAHPHRTAPHRGAQLALARRPPSGALGPIWGVKSTQRHLGLTCEKVEVPYSRNLAPTPYKAAKVPGEGPPPLPWDADGLMTSSCAAMLLIGGCVSKSDGPSAALEDGLDEFFASDLNGPPLFEELGWLPIKAIDSVREPRVGLL